MDDIENLLKSLPAENIDKLLKLQKLFISNSPLLLQREINLLELHNEIIAYSEYNHSPKYTISIKLAFNHLMKFYSPGRNITSLTRYDAEKFIIHLKQKVPEGYRNYFRNLRASFNKAVEWGYLNENPFEKIKLPKRQKIKPAYIYSKELLKICEFVKSEIARDVIITAFYTGMRLSEIVYLTWDCIDLTERTILVGTKEHNTKTKKQRVIPFEDEVNEVFIRAKERASKNIDENYVFARKDGKPFTGDHFSKKFKKACRKAGMPEELHFHSLRHSCASNLVQNGVSIYLVKELLGHSSIGTTEIYSHCDLNSLKEAIKKL